MIADAYFPVMVEPKGPRVEFRLHELLAKHTPPLSQSELARRSGVSLTTVNAMMLNKTTQVSLDTLGKLAEVLHVAPGDIVAHPHCIVCKRRVFDQQKIPNRSLYEVWCEWCGVYFVGGTSKAQLTNLIIPDSQRALISDELQAANAIGKIGWVWGQAQDDREHHIDSMNDEIVERFAMMHGGRLLDCRRDLTSFSTGRRSSPSGKWLVTIDRTEQRLTDVNAMNMTRGAAIKAIGAWYDREFGAKTSKRK